MNNEEKLKDLEARISWNKRHLRIVFILSSITFLALAGHFYLHFTGQLPH